MEWLFVLAVLGGGAFWFLRGNVRRGAEIMRANIFLGSLRQGKSLVEANGYASTEMGNLPPEFVHGATERAHHEYDGLKLAMVGDAYRQGMHPKLPFWERASIAATYKSWMETIGAGRPAFRADGVPSHIPIEYPVVDFADYYATYIAELKRLAGIGPDDLHMVEMMDDEGAKLAFRDGVSPQALAAMVHEHELERQQQG